MKECVMVQGLETDPSAIWCAVHDRQEVYCLRERIDDLKDDLQACEKALKEQADIAVSTVDHTMVIETELANVKKREEELRESLEPFVLFAQSVKKVKDWDKILEPVHTIGKAALVVGAFRAAVEAYQSQNETEVNG